jgi:hypothetical protein
MTFAVRNLHDTRDLTVHQISSIVSRIIGGNIIEGINHRSVRNGNEKETCKKICGYTSRVCEKTKKRLNDSAEGITERSIRVRYPYPTIHQYSSHTPYISCVLSQSAAGPCRGHPRIDFPHQSCRHQCSAVRLHRDLVFRSDLVHLVLGASTGYGV